MSAQIECHECELWCEYSHTRQDICIDCWVDRWTEAKRQLTDTMNAVLAGAYNVPVGATLRVAGPIGILNVMGGTVIGEAAK